MSVNDSQSDVNQPDSFILENGTISHMGLASLTNSRKAGKAALFLCKFLPPALGYRLADAVATQLAADPTTPMFQGIRNNQSAVSLGRLSGEQLEARVLSVLRNITLAFYEQFYFMHRPASLQRKIVRNAVLEQVFSWQEQQRGGLIVCGLHMSSFDLVYQAITQMGLKTVGLSLPEESEAIAWQHQLRRQMGGEIIPATIPNLKRVIHRLQAGEIVVTGIDRPVEGLRGFPLFFWSPGPAAGALHPAGCHCRGPAAADGLRPPARWSIPVAFVGPDLPAGQGRPQFGAAGRR